VDLRQERAYELLNELQNTEKNRIPLNLIIGNQWLIYYKEQRTTEEIN
jgi:hypothetical protein